MLPIPITMPTSRESLTLTPYVGSGCIYLPPPVRELRGDVEAANLKKKTFSRRFLDALNRTYHFTDGIQATTTRVLPVPCRSPIHANPSWSIFSLSPSYVCPVCRPFFFVLHNCTPRNTQQEIQDLTPEIRQAAGELVQAKDDLLGLRKEAGDAWSSVRRAAGDGGARVREGGLEGGDTARFGFGQLARDAAAAAKGVVGEVSCRSVFRRPSFGQ